MPCTSFTELLMSVGKVRAVDAVCSMGRIVEIQNENADADADADVDADGCLIGLMSESKSD